MEPVSFVLNGRRISVDPPGPQATLLDCLRERGLTGAKEGCAEGECGACTVVMVGPEGDASAYRAVNSCLMLLPAVADHEIHTVEALAAGGSLSDAQTAMAAAGGSQCGYCTPGFVMSLFAEQYRPGRTGACDHLALAGNLCRCTGYRPIRDAAASLGPPPPGLFLDRLARPAPVLGAIATPTFSRPTSVGDCLAALAANPGARLLLGGTDLAVEANLHGRRFPHLIALDAVDELHDIFDGPAVVRIGAAVPLNEIARRWRGAPEAWHEWTRLFASPPIRNRATLAGNLATASPIGDGAPLLAALEASVELAGPSGRRLVPVADFFTGYRTTVMRKGEMITAIEIPQPMPDMLRFYKVSKRQLDDISTVAAAMALDRDAAGRITRLALAFGGVAATPIRIRDAEEAVIGQPWTPASVARIHQLLDHGLAPLSDHRGSKEYRRAVSHGLVEKFWWESMR